MNSTTERRRRKKALLIVNPCAGKNRTRANLSEIVDAFPDGVFDFTIKYTTCQGDAINIARDFAREHDLVICCGGDGTLNETINGLMSAGVSVPIGYLPMGSTNDLAATLGIPTKLKEAAELLGVHKNTVTNRVKKCGDILGRDMADPAARMDIEVAMLARRILAIPE